MRTPRSLLPLIAILVFAMPLGAATFVVPPDDVMVKKAPAIVTGTVTGSHSRFNEVGDIETVINIAVDEVLKGALPQQHVQLVEWGGHIGNKWSWVSGAPTYASGKRYLVFLATNGRGEWTTMDLTLGRFEFIESKGRQMLLRDDSEISGWDMEGNPPMEVPRYADRFLGFVRDTVRGEASRSDYFIQESGGPIGGDEGVSEGRSSIAPNFVGYDFVDASTVGAESWTDDPNSNVSYSISGSAATGDTLNTSDGQHRIIEEDPHGNIGGSFGGSGTVATAFSSGSCCHSYGTPSKSYLAITESDVVTQDGVKTSSFTQEKFRTTLVHEIGHTLGFRHSNRDETNESGCGSLPCSTTAIMNSSVVTGLDGQLTSWDQDAVEATYNDGDASLYTSKFCTDYPTCSTFTAETARRSSTSVAWRLAALDSGPCGGPTINTHPSNKTIGGGQSETLSVSATASSGSLSYQWYTGTSGNTSSPVGGATSSSVIVSPSSTTSYWVAVTDTCAEDGANPKDSNAATVTVNCNPTDVGTVSNKTASVGGSANLSVSSSQGSTFEWYDVTATGVNTDESSLEQTGTSKSFNTGTLGAAGVYKYWVKVKTDCGFTRSNVATVTVSSGCTDATIVTEPADVQIASGASTILTVVATGTAPLHYEWHKGTKSSSTIVGTDSSTYNTGALTSDATYWVRVENDCGDDTSGLIDVDVVSCNLPAIASITSDTTVASGLTVNLFVTGTNITSVTWYRGLVGDESQSVGSGLSITSPVLTETSTFWAKATNSCGSVNSSLVTITVQTACTAPVISIEPLSQKVVKNTVINLSVIASGTGPLAYQWYEGVATTDTTKPVGNGTALFTSSPLAKSTKFWVRVTNACGFDDSANATITVPVKRRAVRR